MSYALPSLDFLDTQQTQLIQACCTEKPDISMIQELLLEPSTPETLNLRDGHGNTALSRACEYGQLEVAQLLLIAGAAPSIPEINCYHETVFHWACRNNNLDLLNALFAEIKPKDLDNLINVKDRFGLTPLAICWTKRHEKNIPMINLIIQHGGLLELRADKNGFCLLQYVKTQVPEKYAVFKALWEEAQRWNARKEFIRCSIQFAKMTQLSKKPVTHKRLRDSEVITPLESDVRTLLTDPRLARCYGPLQASYIAGMCTYFLEDGTEPGALPS